MNGVDAIIFTGGIGEKSAYLRELVLEHFTYLGLEIDKRQTRNTMFYFNKKQQGHSNGCSTNEELEIAIETKRTYSFSSFNSSSHLLSTSACISCSIFIFWF